MWVEGGSCRTKVIPIDNAQPDQMRWVHRSWEGLFFFKVFCTCQPNKVCTYDVTMVCTTTIYVKAHLIVSRYLGYNSCWLFTLNVKPLTNLTVYRITHALVYSRLLEILNGLGYLWADPEILKGRDQQRGSRKGDSRLLCNKHLIFGRGLWILSCFRKK